MELFNAIISQAEYFDDLAEGTADTDTRIALRDAANLTTTLARLVNGNGFRAAFGAPGDWGYSTPIGKMLFKTYSGTADCPLLDIEKNNQRYQWLLSRPLDAIKQGGVFAGMTPENVILNGDDLDAAIDKAIAEFNLAMPKD